MSENNGKNTGRIEEITGVVVDVVVPGVVVVVVVVLGGRVVGGTV